MGKVNGEKLKILYIRDYLLKKSDREHPVSAGELMEYLESECGITAERKSIYRDVKILGANKTPEGDGEFPSGYGMDIHRKRGGYYVDKRDFTIEEVKLLVDMVQSSNFITKNKTTRLIKKLEGLTNEYEAKKLNRDVYVRNRVKTINENVYEIIDTISDAINSDSVLHFQYYRYNTKKEKELRHNGKTHVVSPFALIWVDQNYYLLGYNHEAEEMRHFRVDRMKSVRSVKGPRQGKKLFKETDMSTYTTKVFYMFTGKPERVVLRFKNYLADPVIDRFGEDIIIIPDGEEWFKINVEIVVSLQFYAWMSAYRADAEILWPEDARKGMIEHLKTGLSVYEGNQE